MKKLLMVGRTRYPAAAERRRCGRSSTRSREVFDLRVLASRRQARPPATRRSSSAARWRPRRLDGALYFATLPFRTAKELRRSRPDAVLVQGAHETWLVLAGAAARPLARPGRPRHPRRLALVDPAVRLARAAPAEPARRPRRRLRGAACRRRADDLRLHDRARPLVRCRAGGRVPGVHGSRPVPRPGAAAPEPAAGALRRRARALQGDRGARGGLARRLGRLPGVVLHLVGKGTQRAVAEQLVRDLPGPGRVDRVASDRGRRGGARRRHGAPAPSRSEGMGRVLVEAFCRGRGVVGSSVGGIVDLVRDGENGLLVAAAGSGCAGGRDVPRARGSRARRAARRGRAQSAEAWVASPEEYAARLEALVAALR